MKKSLRDKLEQLGYKAENSDQLLSQLPKFVWVSSSDKNFKQKIAFFALLIKGDKSHFTMNVQDEEKEVYVLHEEIDSIPINAIARMIIFVHVHRMIDGNLT